MLDNNETITFVNNYLPYIRIYRDLCHVIAANGDFYLRNHSTCCLQRHSMVLTRQHPFYFQLSFSAKEVGLAWFKLICRIWSISMYLVAPHNQLRIGNLPLLGRFPIPFTPIPYSLHSNFLLWFYWEGGTINADFTPMVTP